MIVKVLQIHKRESIRFDYIQDKFKIDVEKSKFVIADGATQGFESQLWAEKICDTFNKIDHLDVARLIEEFKIIAEEFNNLEYNFADGPMGVIERSRSKIGGTSTFLGLLISEGTAQVYAYGDSNLFLIRDDQVVTSFPYMNSLELLENNYFLNTRRLLDDHFEVNINQKSFSLDNNDIIVMASDAISNLIFNDNEELQKILNISNFEDFKEYCEVRWESKSLQEDDITIVVIENIEKYDTIFIQPPQNFEFSKIDEPTFMFQNKDDNMEKYTKELQKIEYQNKQISNDLKNMKMLLYLLIFGFILSFIANAVQLMKLSLLSSQIEPLKTESIILDEPKIEMHDSISKSKPFIEGDSGKINHGNLQ